MSRKSLPESEKLGANLAVRIRVEVNAALDQAVNGRGCKKSELVVGILEAAIANGSAARLVTQIEAAKVRTLAALNRNEIVRRLQAVEDQRTILRAALDSMDATQAPAGRTTAESDN